ncbi:MAG: hypothetical protein ACOZAO_05710 [Patescibacteria group bacterium]
MSLRLLVARKAAYSNNIYIERTLPSSGDIVAKIGVSVEPFTKLGMTKISYGVMPVPNGLQFKKDKNIGSYFYNGEVIGTSSSGNLIAPFDGYLVSEKDKLVFRQDQRDYWLLSGVWGEVAGIVDKKSILLKTQTLDLHLAACTDNSFAGELIVFPNPSPILEMQYLEKFTKNVFGKIIYTGNYASINLLKKAISMGVGGVLAGGADKYGFDLAKKSNLFLGVFSGHGNIPTPPFIFNALKDISNRFIFVQGERELIRVPVPQKFDVNLVRKNKPRTFLKVPKKGMIVQVFEKPYFGWVGTIEDVQKEKIYVKLDDAEKVIEVTFPNLISLDFESDLEEFLHLQSKEKSYDSL